MTTLKKLAQKFRYGLTLQSIRLKLMKAGIEFTPYILFMEGTNVTDIPAINGNADEYTTVILGPEHMKALSEIDTGFSEADLLNQLDNGQKCIGIIHRDSIVAYMWMNFRELSYKATQINLKNNEAYLWNMYTKESYRGRNLAPYLRYKSYEMLKESGRDVIYSISDSFNSPAIKFKEKLNAERVKEMLYVRFFKCKPRGFVIKSWKN
jgi:ribosomal protein S18 acetylase RimI-like enzyme